MSARPQHCLDSLLDLVLQGCASPYLSVVDIYYPGTDWIDTKDTAGGSWIKEF